MHAAGTVLDDTTTINRLPWAKARRSQGVSNCVELAALPDGQVAVRNSRNPQGPALVYTRAEIAALLDGAKAGEFDHLLEN